MRGVLLLLFCIVESFSAGIRYEDNWESLDSRPLPAWYDEAKVGIFIHWGVFSVPSFGSEWFWQNWQGQHYPEYVRFMNQNYKPGFTYQEFAPEFTAEFYEPDYWAEVFNASGARYVVLTSKHHEGYTLWPSPVSWGWNALDVGPKRDLLGDLATAVRKVSPEIRFGLYHSLYEWFNPLYLQDKANKYNTNRFVESKTMPELIDLVNTYQPDVVWSDGEWEADDTYWNSTTFLAWLFNDSPVRDTVVTNDRWGKDTLCKHGSFYTCTDRYNPGTLQEHKWENCMTLDSRSWGYRRNARLADYLTIEDLLETMAGTVSCGGNLLVNVGPTPEGTIPTVMEERLRQMGEWLTINGEAIYASKPWTVQNDTLTPGVWFTSNGDSVYAIVLSWPADQLLTLGSVSSSASTSITLLGDQQQRQLQFSEAPNGLEVTFPGLSTVTSKWAYVLKMEGVAAAQGRSGPGHGGLQHGHKGTLHGHKGPLHGHKGPLHGHKGPLHGHKGPLHGHKGPVHGHSKPHKHN